MKHSLKKIALISLIVLWLTIVSSQNAAADMFGSGLGLGPDLPGSPSAIANSMMDGIMKKFGVDQQALQETVKQANVARLKKDPPKVTIFYDTNTPEPGQKITATATTTNFANPQESLYFTWFIRHGDEAEADKKKKEDELLKSVEDYKTRAMRIIASGGMPTTNYDYSSDSDNDGFKAPMGGVDQRDKGNEAHCFFHDTKSGAEYEFAHCDNTSNEYGKDYGHLFPNNPETGDGEFGLSEEQSWNTNPHDSDTADLGNVDEANVSGAGRNSFTWTYRDGDQVGVVVEGVSNEFTSYEDSSYKVMWAFSNNNCSKLAEGAVNNIEACDLQNIEINPSQWPHCPDGCTFTRTIKTTYKTSESSKFSGYPIGSTGIQTVTQEIKLFDRRYLEGGVAAEGGAGGSGGSSDGGGGGGGSGGSASAEIGTSKLPYPDSVTCNDTDFIKNAEAPCNPCKDSTDTSDECLVYKNTLNNIIAAIPENHSCCPTGDVPGTGSEEKPPLTWEESYCTIMSTTKDNHIEKSELEPTATVDDQPIFDRKISDMNKCIVDNFQDPKNPPSPVQGGGASGKLDVSLTFTPSNPMNDPSGNEASEITLTAAVNNTKDPQYLYYDWSIQQTDTTNTNEGGDQSDYDMHPMGKDEIPGNPQTKGLGLKEFTFKAQFNDKQPYLRVRVNVSEDAYNGSVNGFSEVFIPMRSIENQITVKSVKVSDGGVMSPDKDICKQTASNTTTSGSQEQTLCRVSKNQILSFSVSNTSVEGEGYDNYNWTVDGEKMYRPDDPSNEPGNQVYYAVLQDNGSTFTVELTAKTSSNGESSGKKLNLSRTFVVDDPEIVLATENEDTCRPYILGYFTDLKNNRYPNYSDVRYEGLQDSTIKLKVKNVEEAPDPKLIHWIVNLEEKETGPSLEFKTDSSTDSYAVTAAYENSPDLNTKTILNEKWKVPLSDFNDTVITKTISIENHPFFYDGAEVRQVTKRILADVFSNMPSYLAFLLRLVISGALIIFISWLIRYALPEYLSNYPD